jgi:hypothetical protein
VNLDLSAATWKKVVRVFVYSFLGVYGAPAIIGALAALRSAAVAGLVAVIALFWNAVMDPSPIPSLNPEESK